MSSHITCTSATPYTAPPLFKVMRVPLVLRNTGARGLTNLTVHVTHAAFIAILRSEGAAARDNLYHATPGCVGLDWETGELCIGVDIPAGGMCACVCMFVCLRVLEGRTPLQHNCKTTLTPL
jgi:hypothetical protein